MKTVICAAPWPRGRLIAVSDIHGQSDWLDGLLERLRFGGGDLLVVVGDLVEKGPRSLKALRRVMALVREGSALATLGNMELGVLSALSAETSDRSLAEYGLSRRAGWGASLIGDMAREAGLSLEGETRGLGEALRARFAPELDFLRSLPTALVIGRYLFVHGGAPTDDLDALSDADAASLLKNDEFLAHAPRFSRWVVVGHWPVTLYRPDYDDSNPLIDRERRVISIDGGCAIKRHGQLNGVILPPRGEDFQWESFDGFPEYVALDAQEPSADPINVRWGHNDVTLLGEEGDSARVLHHVSGRVLSVPKDQLYRHGDFLLVGEYTDYRHAMAPGDRVRLAARCQRGALVKKDGVCGWYAGRLEAIR